MPFYYEGNDMKQTEFEKKIGYTFRQPKLLENAMCHTSYANEHRLGHIGSNERLEFLGDSILSVISAEYLYSTYPSRPEGELTRIRAALVCETALCSYAKQIDLGEMLLLGRGEERSAGRQRPSILADAFEALLAAMYLDGGMDVVRQFLLPFLKNYRVEKNLDYKTELQEIIQKNPGEILHYELVSETGPDHDKQFEVAVFLNSNQLAKGIGHSKKEAEQQAARAALALMGEQNE